MPGRNPDMPSPGGYIKAGHLAILDTKTMEITEREVITEVAPGWRPPDVGFGPMEMMGTPEFVGERAIRIDVPTGRAECFDLS